MHNHDTAVDSNHRFSLIAWLLTPLLIIWVATSYLFGAIKQPEWTKSRTDQKQNIIIKQVPIAAKKPSPVPPYVWDGKGLVTLWFDDGWMSQYTIALPLLSSHSMKGALAVPTQLIGLDGYMSWYHVQKIQEDGWEITAHTRTHSCDTSKMTPQFLNDELVGGKQDLTDNNFQADNFVTPCGIETKLMQEIVKKNYASLRTSEPGFNPLPVTEPYHLLVQTMRTTITLKQVKAWIQEAEKTHTWLIIMFHQVDESKREYSVTPSLLQSILKELETSDIHIVSPSEVLQLEIGTTATPSYGLN